MTISQVDAEALRRLVEEATLILARHLRTDGPDQRETLLVLYRTLDNKVVYDLMRRVKDKP